MNAIGTGSFSGQPFNGAFTIDLAGDTTSVTQPSSGVFFSGGIATVNVAGIGSGTFTDQIVAVSNENFLVGGISDLTIGLALDLIDAPGFASYDLKSALGGITSTVSQLSGNPFPTDHGDFHLTDQSQGTFSATVPEPSSMLLAALGLLGEVVCVQRGRRQRRC
ncbi:MAG TPA: PEP-CTERM sorting domain-containing protein, partial [Lacipirellulaceae bacterium]